MTTSTSKTTLRNNRIPEAINIYWGKYEDGRPNILAFYVNGEVTRKAVATILANAEAPSDHLPNACRNQKLATSHLATLQYVFNSVAYTKTRSTNGKFYQYVINVISADDLQTYANADTAASVTQVSETIITDMPDAPVSSVSNLDWECKNCLADPMGECDACAQFRIAASGGKLSYDELADLNINQDEREIA